MSDEYDVGYKRPPKHTRFKMALLYLTYPFACLTLWVRERDRKMSVFSSPHFHDEEAAYAFVEAHVWPEGRVCPHCGVVDNSVKLKGKSTRIGIYKCYACRKRFPVKGVIIFKACDDML